ncbi:MAG: glycosyltransferase family 4 protein [Phycisphaerae bacterium]|nr:glycosyltransferase family 4 protein [Phycisphaerae bacterium]
MNNKPIRVCFISLKAYPLFNSAIDAIFGGAEVDLYLLSTELAKDPDFQVSFVTGDYGQEQAEVWENVTVNKSVNVGKNLFLGAGRIWKAMRQADAQIYMSEACSLGTFLNAYFCKYFNRIFLYRTASTRECDGTYLNQKKIRGLAVKWAFKKAQAVITQNDSDAENMLRTTGIASTVIRNGSRLLPAQDTQRDTILWVGRSAAVKRPELFIELARQVPEEHFTMICQKTLGDTDYKSLVEQAKHTPNLTFIPRVSFHEIDKYFQRARIFVNTSDSEGFPNTYVQSCKSGAPILSLHVNPDNFLNHYKCGLCADGSWEALVRMLNQLLIPDIAKAYGQNGRHYAEQTNDISQIIDQYKELFRQSSLGRS